MAEDNYDWWRRRLQKMARYFDAYRIDHILGFFRIWEVPRQAQSAILGHFYPSMPYSAEDIKALGLEFDDTLLCSTDLKNSDTLFVAYPEGGFTPRIEGYRTPVFKALSAKEQQAYMQLHEEFFYHRHNDFWRACALKRLPALMATTKMLTCGEDLGMIPACVPDVMREEGILSLEIERMPKELGVAVGNTSTYPYFSVTATSTHDMANIRSWWQEDKELTQRYWRDILHLEGEPEKECSALTAQRIIERQMLSSSILAILPLQDWLATDESLRQADPASERINIPANPNHYWRYRMHLTLEELLTQHKFNQHIGQLVAMRLK
jgi:4-alpha-glucanotransferase